MEMQKELKKSKEQEKMDKRQINKLEQENKALDNKKTELEGKN